MATRDEQAVLEQLADAAAPYLALETFVLGGDRALTLRVLAALAEDGKVTLTFGGQPVPTSKLEDWCRTPDDPGHTSELGSVMVDITDAGLRECTD